MTQEGAAVACAKWRDALSFVRFMIEQISVPALSTCVKMLREGNKRAKSLLLLALLDIYQSKPMRVNMKEPVELEPMKKIDKIRRFSNKELRLSKESMGALPKSSEYCGPIRKKSYSYVYGIIGMAYNPFINEDLPDCFIDYEQAVLLRFWTATIRSATNQQTWRLRESLIGVASCQHMTSSPAIAHYKHGGTPGVVIWCCSGTVESYDGDTMEGSSCKGEQ